MIKNNGVIVIFSFGALLIGLLCIIVLSLYGKNNRHNNRLLACGLFCFSITVFTNALMFTAFPLQFPHFFRTAFPFQYLAPPVFYLYVRGMLYDEKTFRKYDWVHFLPAFLHLVEMMPFYFLGTEEKLSILKMLSKNAVSTIQHREGFLPPFLHPLLKCSQGLIYLIFSAKLLTESHSTRKIWPEKRKATFTWLIVLVSQLLLFYCFMVMVFSLQTRLPNLVNLGNVPVILILLTCAVTLVFQPTILYGFPAEYPTSPNIEPDKMGSAEKKKQQLTLQQISDCKEKMEFLFKEKEAFRQANYTIRHLAADCDLPVHRVSTVINNEMGMSYPDFINGARVRYLIANYHDKDWRQFTLEGIAREAGFSSRNTFISAFKKITGKTPSEYFQKTHIKTDSIE